MNGASSHRRGGRRSLRQDHRLKAPPAMQSAIRMQRATEVLARTKRREAAIFGRLRLPVFIRTPAANIPFPIKRARVASPHADRREALSNRTPRRLTRIVVAHTGNFADQVQPADMMRPRRRGKQRGARRDIFRFRTRGQRRRGRNRRRGCCRRGESRRIWR